MRHRPTRILIVTLLAALQLFFQPLTYASPCLVGSVLGMGSCCCQADEHDVELEPAPETGSCCAETPAPAKGVAEDEGGDCGCAASPEREPARPVESSVSAAAELAALAPCELPGFVRPWPAAQPVELARGGAPPGATRPLRLRIRVFLL